MAKKPEKKKSDSVIDNLAQQLRRGYPQDLSTLADAAGIPVAQVEEGFERARTLLRQGPDPRQVAELATPFQIALLQLAEQADDGDQVTDLMSVTPDKEVKKWARRALHRMRSRGIRVDIPPDGGPSVLDRRAVSEDPPLPCHVGPVDAQGNKIVFLARFVHGGVAVYQTNIHDEDGLVDFAGGVIGRNRYRAMMKELLSFGGERLLEISYEEARRLVSEGAARNRQASKPLPESYLEASAHFPEVAESPPALDAKALFPRESLVDQVELVRAASNLHDLPEFKYWHIEDNALKSVSTKLEEIRTSQLLINEQQRLEQVKRILDGVAGAVIGDTQARNRFQERLFDIAVYLSRIGQKDQARQAAAAAWQLSEEGFKPEDSPFFDRLFKKDLRSPEEILQSMGQHTPSPAEQRPDPGKLIVAP